MKRVFHTISAVAKKAFTLFFLLNFVFSPTFENILLSSNLSAPLAARIAEAAFNQQINYQGKLTDTSNVSVANGSYNIEFKLYTALTGGSPIWTETWCKGSSCSGTGTDSRITVTSGLFSTMLGSTTALTNVDFNQPLYLSINIGGSASTPTWDGEMSPRKILGAVPAAFEAKQLNGLNDTQFLRTDANNSTSTASTFITLTQSGAGNILNLVGQSSASVFTALSSGNIGIGTTSPGQKLSVAGDILGNNIIGSYFTATSSSATSTFAGGLAIETSGFVYDYSTDNVGIGTASPAAKLNSLATTEQLRLSYNAANYTTFTVDSAGNLAIVPSSGNAVSTGGSLTVGSILFANTDIRMAAGGRFYLDNSTNSVDQYSTSGAWRLETSNTERLTVLSGGNVGIGTTSPWRALSVNGSSDLGTNALAGYFTATTSTASVFPYASTTALTISGTNGLQLATGLNGPLQANAGLVSATTSIGVLYGGTGATTFSPNSIITSNAAGTALIATTSNLTVTTINATSTTATSTFAGGLAIETSGFVYDHSSNNVGIGTAAPRSMLEIIKATSDAAKITLAYDSQYHANISYDSSTQLGFLKLQAFTSPVETSYGDIGLNPLGGNVGIGTTSPATTLSVAGSGYFTGGLGVGKVNATANTIDVANTGAYRFNGANVIVASTTLPNYYLAGAGNTTNINTTAVGTNNLGIGNNSFGNSNVTGLQNVGVGISTLYSLTGGSYNTAIGSQAMVQNTTGDYNTAVGLLAGTAIQTGAGNTAIGAQALYQATSTSYNTAIGYFAMSGGSGYRSGARNTAIGAGALSDVSTGSDNIAIGASGDQDNSALANNISGSNNIALGYQTLNGLTTASNNISIGYRSGSAASANGDNNTFLGYFSGFSNTGANNIMLGAAAGQNDTTGSNNIVLGYSIDSVQPTHSNQLNIAGLIYGTSTNSNGRVGIGTTTPGQKLSVAGDILGNNFIGSYFTATSTTASTFAGAITSSATTANTFPYASTTALTISGTNGLQLATGLDGPLQANAGLVSATTSVGVLYGGTGLTSIASSSLLIGGPNNTFIGFATSSLGIAISDTTGTLTVSRGGTGATTYSYGLLLSPGGTTALTNIATSSLGLLTTDVAEGTNLYYTDARFDNRLSATTTLPNLTTLANLVTVGALDAGSIASGFGAINTGDDTITTTGLATFGTLLLTGSSTLQNFTFLNATGTAATTTNFFATTASSTNLFASNLAVGGTVLTTSGGNVGIGTASPAVSLHSTGSIRSGDTSTYTQMTNGTLTFTAPGANYAVSSNGGTFLSLVTATAAPIVFSTDNIARMRITDNGNVGIGTTTPGQKLSVAGDVLGNNFIGSYFTATSTTASTFAGALTSSGVVTGSALVASSASATSTLAGGLAIETSGLVYDYSTNNVGIGTASPTEKLQVAGNIKMAGNLLPSADLTYTVGAAGSRLNEVWTNKVVLSSDTNGAITSGRWQNFAGGIDFYSAQWSLAAFQVNTGADGSNSVQVRDKLSGIAAQTLTLTAWEGDGGTNGSDLVVRGGGSGSRYTTNSGGNLLLQTGLNGDTGTRGYINWSTYPAGASPTLTERMRLDADGNFGIGTTTPTWLLNPSSATAPQLALSAGAGVAQWAFRNAGGNLYFSTTTVAGTATTSISALEISGSGFGTTTVRGLNISGQATSTSNVGFNLTAGCFAVNGACVGGGGGGTVTSVATNNGLTGGTITDTGTIGLNTAGFSTNALLTWDGSNLVATGTPQLTAGYFLATSTTASTFPYASTTALTISGTNGLQLATGLNGPLQANAGLVSATTSIGILYGGTGATSFTTSGNAVYYDGTSLLTAPLTSAVTTPYASTTAITSSGSAYFATSGGNVGIGTTSPSARLSITASGAGTGRSFAIANNSNVENLTVLDSGKVGIGITSPSTKLQIAGTGYAAGFSMIESTTDASGVYIYNDDTYNYIQSTYVGSGALKPFAIGVGGTAMTINTNNNIGIGTSTLAANNKLEVYGDGAMIAANFNASTSYAGFKLEEAGTEKGYLFFVGSAYSDAARRNRVELYTNSGVDQAFMAGATERMIIKSTGSIGIGTTSPSVTGLGVVGDQYITSGLGVGVVETTDGRITANAGLNVTENASTSVLMVNGTTVFKAFGNTAQSPSRYSYFIGGSSGNNTFSSGSNNAHGFNTLLALTSGANNNAFGSSALSANTSGSNNNAFGSHSGGAGTLQNNTTGSSNSAFGASALYSNTTASQNTAVGSGAGSVVTTGSNNSYFGANSGTNVTVGSNNLFLGYDADGINAGDSYYMNIFSLIYATSTTHNSTTANYVGIGTTSPSARLSVTANSSGSILALANSSNIEKFTVTNGGSVGIGSTSPSVTGLGLVGDQYITSGLGVGVVETTDGRITANSAFKATNAASTSILMLNTVTLIKANGGGDGGHSLPDNLFIGNGAGNTTATSSTYENVAVGADTLDALNNGFRNTAIGGGALGAVTSGHNNSGLGNGAGGGITTGFYNLAIGAQTLLGNGGTGQQNVAIGFAAMRDSAVTGSNNTSIGPSAGRSITSGASNVCIGDSACYNTLTTGTSNIAIGGSAGTNGDYNVVIGHTAGGASLTGVRNVALGLAALTKSTGSYNVALGQVALRNNTSGAYNVALGDFVMDNNSTGQYNVALGASALQHNYSATSTVAIGANAGKGTAAHSSQYSTYVGTNSGLVVTTGSDSNTFMGTESGQRVTTGSKNLLLGYRAGEMITTGSSNIIIGYDINSVTTDSNTLNIGNLLFSRGINGLDTTLSTGGLGIGTTTPYSRLAIVNATAASSTLSLVQASGQTANILDIYNTASTPVLTSVITAAGNWGIGTTSPGQKLSVAGDILGNNFIGSYFTATSTTATSTFAGFIDVNGTGTNATSTFASNLWVKGAMKIGTNSIYLNGAATSTFSSGGIELTSGCFAVNGTCVGAGGASQWTTTGSDIYYTTGRVGIGTTSPYAALSVVGSTGVVAQMYTATSTTATTTLAGGLNVGSGGLVYDFSSGITSVSNLELGAMNFDTNAGAVSWADMPVTSDAAAGTVESYSAQIDGNAILTVYSESDTGGGIQNKRVGINNTAPTAALDVTGDLKASGAVTFSSNSITFSGLDTGATADAVCISSGVITTASAAVCDGVSSQRFKHDIATSTLGLSEVLSFRPVSFFYNDGYGDSGVREQFGFIAEEMYAIDPRLAVLGEDGLPQTVKHAFVAPILAQAIKDIGSRIDLVNAPTTTPSISIDALGNVGIGTTSPAYKLHVMGDVGATSFVNISTREAKKDITYLSPTDADAVLAKMKGLNIATYRYNIEPNSNPLRLGLIAEEAPSEILAAGGKGVDIYKLSTFILAGVKAQQTKLESLEIRIAKLEANPTSVSGGGTSISGVIDYLASIGASLTASVAQFKHAIVESLTIGSAEKPSGITLYDEATKQPYCLKIINGATVTVSGKCTVQSGQTSQSSSTESATSTTTSQTSSGSGDTTSPVITITGNNPATVLRGATYLDLGATVEDSVDHNLGVTTTGAEIDTTVVGEYTVEYRATDASGNTATVRRTVVVSEEAAPNTMLNVAPQGDTSVDVTTSDVATSSPVSLIESVTESDTSSSTPSLPSEQATTTTPQ